MASQFDKPASSEAAEKAASDATRTGQNTYGEGCVALRKQLDATPLPDDMLARVNEGDVAKLDGLAHPPILSAESIPLPSDLKALRKSAVCDLVFDIDETGRARTPQARCSDPAFEAHALATLAGIRFDPYIWNGRALPVSGVLMPMEFCTVA
jgi:hypothetical protein